MVLTVPSRVTVIVVHGVADQAPGDTAASFVEMMVAAPLPGVRYEAVGSQSFTVEVEPLAAKWRDDSAGRPDAGRHTFRKALRQSLYSDFRSHPDPSGSASGGIDAGLDYTDYLLHKARRNRMPGESYTSQTTRLMRRAAGEGGVTSTVDVHEMYWADQSRLSGALPRIVTELFTLFFRLSRLGRDTVEIAGRQAGRDPMWRVLSALQTVVDWSFTHVFAQLTALLLVFGLFVAGIGLFAARPAPPADAPFMRDVQECADVKRRDAVCQRDAAQVLAALPAAQASASAPAAAATAAAPANAVSTAGGLDAAARAAGGGAPLQFDPRTAAWLGFLLAVLVWLTLRYQRAVADAPMSRAIARTMVSAALVAVLLLAAWPLKLDPLWGGGLALALVLGSAYAAVLRVAEERFPFVSWSGGLLGAGLLLLALAGGVVTPGEAGALERLQRGGILAIESTLIGVLCWWVFMAVLFPLWGIASATVGLLGYRKGNVPRRCSASTGRLGALVSLLCFLTVTTALWMGLSGAVKSGLTELSYTPTFWKEESVPAAAAPSIEWARYLMLCDGGAAKGAERNAAQFIDCRFRGNTAAFSAAVAMLSGVAVYLLATLLPSVLAELGWARSDSAAEARRLGIWLTRRYRHLDRWVLAFTLLAIAFVLFVGFELLWHRIGGTTPDWFGTTQQGIARVSDELLRWLVIPGASALAVLTAFGGVLSRLLPGLRAPLDVALDVDNYLREFPRAAIPRARIFARYAALLRHIARQGYDRVVVVAHSQGTVISAELLRYLSSDVQAARQATASPGSAGQGRGTRLQALLQTQSLRLLTLGCPLRQLYAARFPVLYGWVMQDHGGTVGPRADDIGVERWFNAYGSGDYVGRWLWNDGTAPRSGMHPVDDVLSGTGGPGPRSLYDIVQPPAAAREFQTCIGLAAHTHYFDPPDDAGAAPTVALLADALVAEPMNLKPK